MLTGLLLWSLPSPVVVQCFICHFLFQDWPEANIPSWEVQGYIMRKAAERTQWQARNPQLFFRGGLHPGLASSSHEFCNVGCSWCQTYLGRHKAASFGSPCGTALLQSDAVLTSLRLAGQRDVVEGVDWQPLAKHFDVTFFSSPHDMGTVRSAVPVRTPASTLCL